MGYSGNHDPAFIIPSAVADKIDKVLLKIYYKLIL